ncbi:MFS transporter [Nocardiopsis coralliicola]
MSTMDMSILFLVLPGIAADLAPGSTQQLWMLHAGDLFAVGVALVMGRLGDRLGRRRLLAFGAAGFGAASLGAAFAPTPEALIGMRALLGVSAATFAPSVLGLLREVFRRPRQFSVAVAVVMSMFSAGMALGPPVGGILLDTFWWGAVFLVNVPVAVLVLAVVPLLPPRRGSGRVRLDLRSVLFSMIAVAGLVYGLQEFADAQGRPGAQPMGLPLAAAAVGAAAGVAFIRRQRRAADPLLDLRLFANPGFTAGVATLLLMLLALAGGDMLFAQFLQAVQGLPPARAGLLLVVPAVFSLLGGLSAPLLLRWMRPAFALGGSLAAAAGGAAAMVLAVPHGDTAVLIGVSSAVALAIGPVFAIGTNLAVASVREESTGEASAVADIAGGLGNALGLAVLGSIAAVSYRAVLVAGAPEGLPDGAVAAAGESIGGAAAAAEALPGAAGALLTDAAGEAFTAGFQLAYGTGAVLAAVLALAVAVLVRRTRLDGAGEGGPAGASPAVGG